MGLTPVAVPMDIAMNFSYVWKVMSGLPLAYTAIIILLSAGAIVGALIALWNAVPLTFEHLIEMWRRHMRRTARRRRHAAQGNARQQGSVAECLRVHAAFLTVCGTGGCGR